MTNVALKHHNAPIYINTSLTKQITNYPLANSPYSDSQQIEFLEVSAQQLHYLFCIAHAS